MTSANAAIITNLFAAPAAIAFDPAGRLFVSDSDNASFARVLVFVPLFSNSSAAARIMGEFPPNLTQPPSQDQIAKTVFSCVPNNCLGGVNAIFFIPGSSPKVGLLDQGGSRIVLFDSYDNWPDPSTSYSPQATGCSDKTGVTPPAISTGGPRFPRRLPPSLCPSPPPPCFLATIFTLPIAVTIA